MYRMFSKAAVAAMACGVMLAAAPVQAAQLSSLYQSTRALGMGGAFTAVADDYSALYTNPAGLAQLQKMHLDLINVEAEVSESTQDLINDIDGLQGGTEQQAIDLLRAHTGDHFRLRVDLQPNVVGPGFGVGILTQATLDGDLRNQQNPRVDVNARVDAGVTVAGAKGFKRDRLQVGVGAKYIARQGLVTSLSTTELVAGGFDPLSDVADREGAFAFDLGLLFHFEDLPMAPTVGVSYLNIGNLDFGVHGEVPSQVHLGLALRPSLGPLDFTVAVDFVDLSNNLADDSDKRKRLNYGAEVELWDFLAVRVGIHQSYFSAGATLDLWILKLDVATYGEELGAYGGQREDRRYIARIDLF